MILPPAAIITSNENYCNILENSDKSPSCSNSNLLSNDNHISEKDELDYVNSSRLDFDSYDLNATSLLHYDFLIEGNESLIRDSEDENPPLPSDINYLHDQIANANCVDTKLANWGTQHKISHNFHYQICRKFCEIMTVLKLYHVILEVYLRAT